MFIIEQDFKNKNMKHKRIGEIFNTKYGDCIIIDYKSNTEITIKFFDNKNTIINNIHYNSLKSGSVKNPNFPTVNNVGYIGQGKYLPKLNKNYYIIWTNLLKRCYDKKLHLKHPTYINCTVDERWHNFQVFAEWCENNYIDGFQLDKDILIKRNKFYSPETCCFVPQEINNLFIKCDNKRGNLPIGICKNQNGYQIQICLKNNKYSKYHNNINSAFSEYVELKKQLIIELANKHKLLLNPNVYNALINYIIEIND